MKANDAAAEFNSLYAAVYHQCHQRQSPREFRVSTESLALLRHLEQSGPLTVKEAAAHFDRSQAATSEMIQRLIDRELLERMPDERDRRRHLVWLTETALELLRATSRPLSDELVAAALETMSAADRAELIRTLRMFVESARQLSKSTKGTN